MNISALKFVICIGVFWLNPGVAYLLSVEHSAKASDTRNPIAVSVANSSNEHKLVFAYVDVPGAILRKRAFGTDTEYQLLTGDNDSLPREWQRAYTPIFLRSASEHSQKDSGADTCDGRGGVSDINYSHISFGCFAALRHVTFNKLNSQAGAMARNELLFSKFEGGSPFDNGSDRAPPQQRGENPETTGRYNQETGEYRYPPVWTRIPLAMFLGLGSNGVMVWGLLTVDRRRSLGVALCILAVGMFFGGDCFLILLAFPATWGWPV